MPIKLQCINNTAIQSGAAMNIAEAQCVSTNSKMAMQAAAGSFNQGYGNFINNCYSGNLASSVNDPDVVDITQIKRFLPKFL
ncbi:spore germination protein [Wukongibacter sp. M2B1]|uniref:spore germination protein n=1 Tax=Wukongibacter sp. M2B1 TaxID=3088895 RepID=UPI003D7BBC2F